MKMTVAYLEDNYCNHEAATWGSEREVLLVRDKNKSFGISIVGGKVNVGDSVVSGIFIKNIIPNSPAAKCGLLKIGDRILAVDGNDIRDSTHENAVSTIKRADDTMTLLIQSLNKNNTDITSGDLNIVKKIPPPITPSKTPDCVLIQEGRLSKCSNKSEKEIKINGDIGKNVVEKEVNEEKPIIMDTLRIASPESRCASVASTVKELSTESEGSDSEDEDTRNMEGKTVSKAGQEIDRASAGNVKRSKDEITTDNEAEDEFGYTTYKIKKRYGSLGQVVCHTIDRGTNGSLGISLAGHRDRTKMACFVAGINPKGVASSAPIEIGDEILEVNGIVLHGRCHLNASAIIKGIAGPTLKIIILRKKEAVDELAVKPVTQFPVNIDEDEDLFASFKNVKHVTIKKGTSSLGIMIIEGKHADVGQGIFVSDIQEGSNAEKAGLSIGDMILAVNKDSLLGCSYENAANLLRKTEGVVTLTICNPNKKEDVKKDATGTSVNNPNVVIENDTSSNQKGASRSVTPKPQASPAKEILDPLVAEIRNNDHTTVDFNTDKKPLGIFAVGGCDTLINNGAVIVDIIPKSIVDNDKRLQVFDQILEINSVKITPELTSEQLQRAIRQLQPKVRMIIYRADPSETETVEVELFKKPGKMLGLGIQVGNPKGIFISDVIPGGIVDLDGRIQKGDIVTHVNSESISNKSLEDCSLLLKTVQGRVVFKILRPKPKKRSI